MGKYSKIWILLFVFFSCIGYSQKIIPVDSLIKPLKNITSNKNKAGEPEKIPYQGYLQIQSNQEKKESSLSYFQELKEPGKYSLLFSDRKYFLSPDSIFRKMAKQGLECVVPNTKLSFPSRYKDNAVINVKYYDIDQGLSSSYVYDIEEDKNGMLWIATNGGGVNRFDGSQFLSYSEANGLANDMVKSIACDSKGNIWFGTINGISVYNGKYFTNYTVENGLSDNHINDILIDKKNRVWIGTRNAGLNIIENSTIKQLDKSINFPSTVYALDEDEDGNIWVGTTNGLYCISNKFITHFSTNEGLVSNAIHSVEAINSKYVYVGTDEGLNVFQNDSIKYIGTDKGLPSFRINEILYDGGKGVFIGSNGGGLYRIINGTVIRLSDIQGLSSNEIHAIHKDRSNIYWMGTWGGGLNRYDGFSFLHFNKAHGLPTNIFPAMSEHKNGDLWFGSFGEGLLKYTNKQFYRYFKEQGFFGEAVWSMIFDSFNNLWIATDSKGIYRFDGKDFYNFDINTGFPENSTWSLLEDRNQNIWIGTASKGLIKFDGTNWKQYAITESPVISLYEDSKGNIWAMTWGDGIYMLGGKMLSHFSGNKDFPADKVYNMYEDNNGYLWFATSGNGIVIYNGARFYSILKNDGLTSDITYWVKKINKKILLIGSESGLIELVLENEFDPSYPDSGFVKTIIDTITLKKKLQIDGNLYSINTYGIAEGFTGHDCIGSQNSVIVSQNGYVWMGTGNQLTRYDPTTEMTDTSAASIHIKSIQVSLQDIDWSNYLHKKTKQEQEKYGVTFDSINPLYVVPQGLSMSYRHNQITFEFVAIDWKNPQKIFFKYKLEGLNEEWSLPTRDSKAMFTNLKPGEYKLKVKVINSDLVWSKPLIYRFTIETPWWQTMLFRLSIIIIIVLSIIVYIRLRIASLRKQKSVLESMVVERTKEILSQKEEIQAQRDALNATNIHLERLSIVARETTNGVLIADYRGNIEWINEGYTNLLGYNLEQLKENKGINLFFIYKSENTLEFFKKCKDEKVPVTFSSIYEKSDQTEIWLQTTVTPIFENDGELQKYVVIYADITQLKDAQGQNEVYIREITASIRYASRIQNSILPLKNQMITSEIESFAVYKPKDIVGGDFYWFSKHGLNYLAGVVDCTGHGVPGALMTVIAYAAMSKVITDKTAKNPARLLQLINHEVRKMLRQYEDRKDRSDDGLDISLSFIKPLEKKVIFAGAKQSLFYSWSNEIDEIKGDRQSIGYVDSSEDFEYTNHEIDIRYHSIFYMASDGFKDMPINKDGQLLGKKNFRQLLKSISSKGLDEQKQYLENIMEKSSGNFENYDDITIFGFRVKE